MQNWNVKKRIIISKFRKILPPCSILCFFFTCRQKRNATTTTTTLLKCSLWAPQSVLNQRIFQKSVRLHFIVLLKKIYFLGMYLKYCCIKFFHFVRFYTSIVDPFLKNIFFFCGYSCPDRVYFKFRMKTFFFSAVWQKHSKNQQIKSQNVTHSNLSTNFRN